ncbi:hypothetical protein [Kitasatospora sp. NPDC056531]|uniref:hypothetical protein n=1 Tax=Kitasatospora sp. NPDC056531 TaxID=3345856 RepID=UPI0036A50A59
MRSLARHAGPGRSVDLLALLAFMSDKAPVPELALKRALAKNYFPRRQCDREAITTATAEVPKGFTGDDVYYDMAEAEAKLEVRNGGPIIRQMRRNLRRRPDLAKASRGELDDRLIGVLTNLNRPELPEDDLEFMADLEAVLALDTDESSLAVIGVWEYLAISHAGQMAEQTETSGEERLDRLFAATMADLESLRAEVGQRQEQNWERASVGLLGALPLEQPRLVRHTAAELVEWMSAKTVHPAGTVMADRYYIDSLSDLYLRCFIAGAKRLAEQDERAANGKARRSSEGEGRAAFIARTSGATKRHRRGG